jgi:hypothetical protein
MAEGPIQRILMKTLARAHETGWTKQRKPASLGDCSMRRRDDRDLGWGPQFTVE